MLSDAMIVPAVALWIWSIILVIAASGVHLWSGDLVNPLASGSLADANDRNNRQTYGPSPVLVQPGEYIELLVTKTATSPFGDFVGTNFHVETEVAALAVPEPATLLILLVSGLAAAGGLGRKRRQP